jgi:hypothetical protein
VFGSRKDTYSAAREESSKGSSILSKSGSHKGGSSKGDNSSRLHLEGYNIVDWKKVDIGQRKTWGERFDVSRQDKSDCDGKLDMRKKETKPESGWDEVFEPLRLTRQVHAFEGSTAQAYQYHCPDLRVGVGTLPFLQFAWFPLSWNLEKPPRSSG